MQGSFNFDLDHPYLKRQLIAYIGNKRALQPLLYRVFAGISEKMSDAVRGVRGPALAQRGVLAPAAQAVPAPAVPAVFGTFLDPFAGSGAVARLARYLGFKVLANDWEPYAYVLNFAHLCVDAAEAGELFRSRGGPQGILAELNALQAPPEEERYISRYYAPVSTEEADYRRERLFYTRENALKIDAVRTRIEELYPGRDLPGPADTRNKEKLLLLAALLYQCATHTNTSGVFKACHKGFGGHSRDALGRIMARVELEMPVLFDGEQPAEAGCQDAAEFVRSRPADLCYLDPPYNQHQYGSNYHLLNTIALWDRPAVSNELKPDGRLKHKAAIRTDWVRTRSPYCYRRSAPAAFRELLEAIDARYIVVSYNTEGIIPFEELVDTLAAQGQIVLFANEYVKYRGGRQSIDRQLYNLEFVLVLDRSSPGSGRDRQRIEQALLRKRVLAMLKRSYCPDRICRSFAVAVDYPGELPLRLGMETVSLPMPHLYRFAAEALPTLGAAASLEKAGPDELAALLDELAACECRNRQEEIEVLVGILAGNDRRAGQPVLATAETAKHGVPAGAKHGVPASTELQKRVLWLLRKFAHRKYRGEFEATVSALKTVIDGEPRRFSLLAGGLAEVEALARARFRG